MAIPAETHGAPIEELTREDGQRLFDQAARHYLGMSGEEFLKVWKAGQYEDVDTFEVMAVAMLLPLVEEPVGR